MLVLRCGDATLREARASDDDQLVGLLPDDFDHDPTFGWVAGEDLLGHRQRWLRVWLRGFRESEPGDHFLPFVVEADGRTVGFQVLEGRGFAESRTVDSSSFLTPDARGRGLGRAMRTAVLWLAFEQLGAERAETAARPDNHASRRVSETVGYTFVGRREPIVAGAPRPIDCFEFTRADWATRLHPAVTMAGRPPMWV